MDNPSAHDLVTTHGLDKEMDMTIAILMLVLCPPIILGIDYWLYKSGRSTISQVIIKASKLSPMVPALIGFFIGVLFGHWWG